MKYTNTSQKNLEKNATKGIRIKEIRRKVSSDSASDD